MFCHVILDQPAFFGRRLTRVGNESPLVIGGQTGRAVLLGRDETWLRNSTEDK